MDTMFFCREFVGSKAKGRISKWGKEFQSPLSFLKNKHFLVSYFHTEISPGVEIV